MFYTFSYVKDGILKNLQIEAIETNFEIDYTELAQWGAVNNRTYNLFGTIGGGQTGTKYYYQYITQLGDPYTRFSALPSRIYTGLIGFVDWTDTRYQLVMSEQMDFISGDTLLNNSYKKLHCGKGHVRLNFAMKTVYEQGQPVTKFVNSGFANFNPNDYESDQGLIAVSGSTAAYTYDSRYRSPNLYFMRCTLNVNTTGTPYDGKKLPIVAILRSRYDAGADYPSYSEIIFIDERLIDGGTPITPSGSDPNKNSTATGWKGERDTTSNSDIITGASRILLSTVNFGDHGTFLYKVNPANLEKLEKSLWSNSLMDKFKDYIYSPSSGILACNALPYTVSIFGEETDLVTIKLCGTEAKYSSSDFSNPVQNQVPGLNPTYVYAVGNYAYASQQISQTYKNGNISPAGIYIKPFFNSFLDFEPYTKIQVRLPYIGTVPIPTSSCMGGYLFVNYVTDNRNGNIMAQIYTCSKRNYEDGNARGWVLIGQWTGNCATPIPLVGNSMGSGDVVGAIKGFASNAAGTILDDSPTSLVTSAVKSGLDMVFARNEPRIVGTLNANAGVLGDGTCRVIISRPVDVTPGTYKMVDGQRVFESNGLIEQKGIASYSGGTVGQYTGVTQGYVLGNIDGATEGEMLKIRSLFADGVNIKEWS